MLMPVGKAKLSFTFGDSLNSSRLELWLGPAFRTWKFEMEIVNGNEFMTNHAGTKRKETQTEYAWKHREIAGLSVSVNLNKRNDQ